MKSILFALLLTCVSLQAAGTKYPVSVQFVQFKGDSVHTRLELSFSLPDSMLVYREMEGSYHAKLHFALNILRAGSTIVHDEWDVVNVVHSSSDPLRNAIVGMRAEMLDPGPCEIQLSWVDSVRTTRRDSMQQSLSIRSFRKKTLTISDLLFCSSIQNAESAQSAHPFNHNGLMCVPLPSCELRGTSPSLHCYLELYGLDTLHSDSVNLAYQVLDGADRSVLDAEERIGVRAEAQATLFEQMVDILPTGTYSLHCNATIDGRPDIDTQRAVRKFYILNPDDHPALTGLHSEDELFLASEFATMNEKAIEEEYEKAMIVGPETELLSFHQLTSLTAKQKYIFRFWFQKDPDPTTPVNERYEDLRKAVRYAGTNYKSIYSKRGWDSEMGRVLLKYGFPTHIDHEIYNTDGAYPHEIWSYDNIQGGVQFVFVNVYNRGKYIMVHSTALNEKHEPNWYDMYATDRSKRY